MDPLFRLETMLSDYKCLFKHNNFNHFCTFVMSLINTPHRGTMTQVYESGKQSTIYWALPKFLYRGIWCVDERTSFLTRQVQSVFSKGVYVYDETKSVVSVSSRFSDTEMFGFDDALLRTICSITIG